MENLLLLFLLSTADLSPVTYQHEVIQSRQSFGCASFSDIRPSRDDIVCEKGCKQRQLEAERNGCSGPVLRWAQPMRDPESGELNCTCIWLCGPAKARLK